MQIQHQYTNFLETILSLNKLRETKTLTINPNLLMGFSIIKEIESNKETKSKPWQQWSQYARVSPIEKPWFYNPNHIQQKEITIPSIIIKKKKR